MDAVQIVKDMANKELETLDRLGGELNELRANKPEGFATKDYSSIEKLRKQHQTHRDRFQAFQEVQVALLQAVQPDQPLGW